MKKWFENVTKTDTRNLLAFAQTIMIAAVIMMLFVVKVPSPNKDALYLVLGGLLSKYGDVISFFFGSSKREVDTDKQNANG